MENSDGPVVAVENVVTLQGNETKTNLMERTNQNHSIDNEDIHLIQPVSPLLPANGDKELRLEIDDDEDGNLVTPSLPASESCCRLFGMLRLTAITTAYHCIFLLPTATIAVIQASLGIIVNWSSLMLLYGSGILVNYFSAPLWAGIPVCFF